MTNSNFIPTPPEWGNLTASDTRFGIMYELYSIAHWYDPRYSDRLDTYIKGFCDTFFDDYPMADNPTSMIGQSLYADEITQVGKFIKDIEPIFYGIDIPKVMYKVISKNMVNMSDNVVQSARDLYELMLKKGDPEIEKYYK
ncbi:MAG: hypothetical protein ABI668_00135 [Sphingorhabdus sp.]